MTAYTSRPASAALAPPPTWARVLLGIVLILAGIVVLGDVMVATLISAIVIGIVAIIAGAFEIVACAGGSSAGRSAAAPASRAR